MSWIVRAFQYWLSRPNTSSAHKDSPKLEFSVLGTSHIAYHALIRGLRRLQIGSVSSVFSSVASNARKFAKRYDIQQFASPYSRISEDDIKWSELESGYKCVYICTKSESHRDLIEQVLNTSERVHVLCEKPMCLESQTALDLKTKAEQKGVVLMEGYHYRFHPLMLELQQILSKKMWKDFSLGPLHGIEVELSAFSLSAWWNHRYIASNDEVSKLNNKFCYCVDLSRMCFESFYADHLKHHALLGFDVEVRSATIHSSRMHSSMKYVFETEEGTSSVFVTLKASARDRFGLPASKLRLKFENCEISVNNFNFPFIFHSLRFTRDGITESEEFYGDGSSTFEYQLREFKQKVEEMEAGGNLGKYCGGLNSAKNSVITHSVLRFYNAKMKNNKRFPGHSVSLRDH